MGVIRGFLPLGVESESLILCALNSLSADDTEQCDFHWHAGAEMKILGGLSAPVDIANEHGIIRRFSRIYSSDTGAWYPKAGSRYGRVFQGQR